MDQSAFAPKKNNNTLTLVWSLALALFALLLAIVILNYFNIFLLSKTYPAAFGWLPHKGRVNQTVLNNQDGMCAATSPLFKSQSATIQGKILRADGSLLVIQDDKGQEGKFLRSDSFSILVSKEGGGSQTFSDLSALDPSKSALILLRLEGREFRAVSVAYLP